jgi:hypothetical protein
MRALAQRCERIEKGVARFNEIAVSRLKGQCVSSAREVGIMIDFHRERLTERFRSPDYRVRGGNSRFTTLTEDEF